ncbi:MAG: DNA polymerase III subunit delta [Alphaproteobacteria bacterium]|nr:DNA polymerase III subunit delta [Alphaproteobacteria bacterium]
MKLKAHEVDGWVKGLRADKAPALVLVYGPDRGGVHETAKALRHAYLGDAYDPLQYVALDEGALAGQPGLLADEAAALPMFGEHKLVHISGGDAAVQAAVKFFLATLDAGATMSGAAMVIVETDNLRPTAPLRKAAEGHKAAMALPCYALEARDIGRLIRQYLEQENYRIEAQAMDLLTARLATDRGVIQRELERLVLYKGVRAAKAEPGMVTGDDVEAALGDQAQGDFDRLIDSVALGRLDEADRAMARLEAAGTNAAGALAMARLHFQTLHLALGQMERGTAQTKALGAFRPPLHFRRKPLVEQQMRLWSSSKCARALEILNAAEKACRGSAGGLAQAQAGNALLRIARAAQR